MLPYSSTTFVMIGLLIASLSAADPMSGDALYQDVVRYDQIGHHRTGTPGDKATSKWVAEELEGAG